MDLGSSLARVINDGAPSGGISRQVSGGTAEQSSASPVVLSEPVMRSILSCEDIDMSPLGFDFHGYSRFLQDHGVQRKEADTFAEATDRFVMGPLHRKAQDVTSLINAEVATREDIAEVKGEIQAVRHEVDGFRQEFKSEVSQLRQEFAQVRLEIQVAQQKAIITVGVMLATAVGILSAVIGLFA